MEKKYNYHFNPESFKHKENKGKTNKWRYELLEDFTMDVYFLHDSLITFSAYAKHKYFTIKPNGEVHIKKGYAWNGANKPAYNNKQNLLASLLHDVICQATGIGVLPYKDRRKGDRVFLYLMLDRAKSVLQRVRAWYSYFAVAGYTIVKGIVNKPKYRG